MGKKDVKSGKMADDSGAVWRLVPEFDGSGDISDWLDKVDLVCEVKNVQDVVNVIALRLTGRAYAVYKQIPNRR